MKMEKIEHGKSKIQFGKHIHDEPKSIISKKIDLDEENVFKKLEKSEGNKLKR